MRYIKEALLAAAITGIAIIPEVETDPQVKNQSHLTPLSRDHTVEIGGNGAGSGNSVEIKIINESSIIQTNQANITR